jgi:hypothetical protein
MTGLSEACQLRFKFQKPSLSSAVYLWGESAITKIVPESEEFVVRGKAMVSELSFDGIQGLRAPIFRAKPKMTESPSRSILRASAHRRWSSLIRESV